jgi:hypothetical protein
MIQMDMEGKQKAFLPFLAYSMEDQMVSLERIVPSAGTKEEDRNQMI